jgi:chromosome segregation ATPase
LLTPPFVHPQALATATAAVEEVKSTAAAAELAVAEAEEAQRDAVPEIAALSAALIAIRTHQIQAEAAVQTAETHRERMEGRAEALTAQYTAVKQSATEVQRILQGMPDLPTPDASALRQVRDASAIAMDDIIERMRTLEEQLTAQREVTKAALEAEATAREQAASAAEKREALEFEERRMRDLLTAAGAKLQESHARLAWAATELVERQRKLAHAERDAAAHAHGYGAKADAANLALVSAQARHRTATKKHAALVEYQHKSAEAAAAATARADDARALLEREDEFQQALSGTSTAVPPVVLARVRESVLASKETAEQLLAPARIATLATSLKYSLQHTLDAITAVVDEQQAMAEGPDALPGAGERWKYRVRSPPRLGAVTALAALPAPKSVLKTSRGPNTEGVH